MAPRRFLPEFQDPVPEPPRSIDSDHRHFTRLPAGNHLPRLPGLSSPTLAGKMHPGHYLEIVTGLQTGGLHTRGNLGVHVGN